jgi:hypothetical protein
MTLRVTMARPARSRSRHSGELLMSKELHISRSQADYELIIADAPDLN